MIVHFADLFLAFLIYGLIGWIYESTLWAISETGKFTNRGFMIGPVCPIYGVVSLMDWYLLHEISNPVKIFITACLVCSMLEYFTSWLLEKIFHARWWDYSNYSFNLNGRISLYSSVLFGLAGLLLVKVVHPTVMGLLGRFSPDIRLISSGGLFCLFISDLVVTIVSINELNRKVKQMYEAVLSKCNVPFDYINEYYQEMQDNVILKKSRGILMTMENINIKLKNVELRILKAFPSFRSTKYNALFSQIRNHLEGKKSNKINEDE